MNVQAGDPRAALGWVVVEQSGVPYLAGSTSPLALDEANRLCAFLGERDHPEGDYRVYAVIAAAEYDRLRDVGEALTEFERQRDEQLAANVVLIRERNAAIEALARVEMEVDLLENPCYSVPMRAPLIKRLRRAIDGRHVAAP